MDWQSRYCLVSEIDPLCGDNLALLAAIFRIPLTRSIGLEATPRWWKERLINAVLDKPHLHMILLHANLLLSTPALYHSLRQVLYRGVIWRYHLDTFKNVLDGTTAIRNMVLHQHDDLITEQVWADHSWEREVNGWLVYPTSLPSSAFDFHLYMMIQTDTVPLSTRELMLVKIWLRKMAQPSEYISGLITKLPVGISKLANLIMVTTYLKSFQPNRPKFFNELLNFCASLSDRKNGAAHYLETLLLALKESPQGEICGYLYSFTQVFGVEDLPPRQFRPFIFNHDHLSLITCDNSEKWHSFVERTMFYSPFMKLIGKVPFNLSLANWQSWKVANTSPLVIQIPPPDGTVISLYLKCFDPLHILLVWTNGSLLDLIVNYIRSMKATLNFSLFHDGERIVTGPCDWVIVPIIRAVIYVFTQTGRWDDVFGSRVLRF